MFCQMVPPTDPEQRPLYKYLDNDALLLRHMQIVLKSFALTKHCHPKTRNQGQHPSITLILTMTPPPPPLHHLQLVLKLLGYTKTHIYM